MNQKYPATLPDSKSRIRIAIGLAWGVFFLGIGRDVGFGAGVLGAGFGADVWGAGFGVFMTVVWSSWSSAGCRAPISWRKLLTL